ncbi:hypothetical protein GQ600_26266 [Phytophthora cactorum]|nr:hypothetical protein GQ600_26266 [Phytophthora cactorum]
MLIRAQWFLEFRPVTTVEVLGVTWQSDGGLDMGMLHANGYPNQGCPASELEILLAVRLTRMAVPQLRFYLNGDLTLPLRRTTNSGGVAGLLDLILVILLALWDCSHEPSISTGPVVSMYSSSKKPQMRVTFNFRGDFKFPILGFDPFGAPL